MSDILPPLPEGFVDTLVWLERTIETRPRILDGPTNYPKETVALLKRVLAPRPVAIATPAEPRRDMEFGDLKDELQRLYVDLESYGQELDTDDKAQKGTYFRIKFGILKEITELLARIEGLTQVGEFQRAVIDILETVCGVDQRTEIMKRLGKAA